MQYSQMTTERKDEQPIRASDRMKPPRRVLSSELFQDGSTRVIIRHDDRDYVLILTKRGKLVLNLLG